MLGSKETREQIYVPAYLYQSHQLLEKLYKALAWKPISVKKKLAA